MTSTRLHIGWRKTAFESELERNLKLGKPIRSASGEYDALRKAFVPPYDPGKFPNKWWKLRADMPSRTLMAHIGKDTYSHIHYDAAQARTISVREAARLQSFPDGFLFEGTMNPAFRQIGNAVPREGDRQPFATYHQRRDRYGRRTDRRDNLAALLRRQDVVPVP